MVIVNSEDKAKELNTARFAERILQATTATNIITGEKINNINTINIPASNTLVLELN